MASAAAAQRSHSSNLDLDKLIAALWQQIKRTAMQ
jgi:hypothetical protein